MTERRDLGGEAGGGKAQTASEDAFLDRMSSVLETPVGMATRFREVPFWSSLMGFGILVTLENDFGRRMTVDEFLTCHTIGDLWKSLG